MRMFAKVLAVVLLSVFTGASPNALSAEEKSQPAEGVAGLPKKSEKLFELTKIWTVHLKFTPEQWTAMEPKSGAPGGFGGGPGGPGGAGGPPRFQPSMLLAPGFLQAGDCNADGQLTAAEFQSLGEKWFRVWDKEKTGQVTAEQLRAGLNTTFAPPEGATGGPPRGGGGPPLLGQEGQRNGLASALGIVFPEVHADLEFEGQWLRDVAVRYKGNGTFMQARSGLKRSLKIDLNEFSKGQKIAGRTTLNLHSNVTDAGWMNEVLSYRLYRDAGVPAPRTAYARVYVTVPGKHERQYLGLYSLVENPDKDFAEYNFETKKGAMFKPVTPSLFTDLGDAWSKYKQIYDAKDEVSTDDAQRVMDFARLVTKAEDAEFAAKLGDYMDLDAAARYFAVTVWLATMDSILSVGQNYYLYLHPKTRRFQLLPWDLDHSFGQFMGGEANARLDIHQPWRGENRFLTRLFKVAAFKQLYLAKLSEFNATLFAPERLAAQVDALAAVLRPAVGEESKEKLANFDRVAAGEAPQAAAGGESGGMGDMGAGKPIKPFAKLRAEFVRGQLTGKAVETPAAAAGPGFGPGVGGPGGRPGGFRPGPMLAPAFLAALDADKDGQLSHAEATQGFARWFAAWDGDHTGFLTAEKLRTGIDKDFAPPPGTFPGGPGGGPR